MRIFYELVFRLRNIYPIELNHEKNFVELRNGREK
jgi:hypothetical protein